MQIAKLKMVALYLKKIICLLHLFLGLESGHRTPPGSPFFILQRDYQLEAGTTSAPVPESVEGNRTDTVEPATQSKVMAVLSSPSRVSFL